MIQKRVLVLDDDLTHLTLLRRVLADCGFDALTAMHEASARGILATGLVDVVLMGLPAGDERTSFLDEVHFSHPSIPVIVLCADDSPSFISRVLQSGAYTYFQKPYDIDALIMICGQAARKGGPS